MEEKLSQEMKNKTIKIKSKEKKINFQMVGDYLWNIMAVLKNMKKTKMEIVFYNMILHNS